MATTWNEAARQAILELRSAQRFAPATTKLGAEERVNMIRDHAEALFAGDRISHLFAIWDLVDELMPYFGLMADDTALLSMLVRKQRGYGPHNITKFGMRGVAVRLSDKVERLANLMAQDRDGNDDEALMDTLIDMAGYCVVGLMNQYGDMTLRLETVPA